MSKKKHFSIGLMIWLCMFLAGCQSEKPGQSKTPTPVMTPVSLQLQWVTQAQFAGYYVALDKGWYRDETIDLTIVPGGPDLVPVDLVAAGTKDFGTTLLADLTVAKSTGKPVISIAQIQQANGLRLLARKSTGIETPEDFKGKKVGVWLGSWEAQFNALMAHSGLTPTDVAIVSQGWSMEPFIRGELDVASAMIYNEYQMVLASGIQPQELNVIDYADFGLDFPGDVLFTSIKRRQENPDLCLRMLRASLKGWHFAIDHPEEAADIVLKFDKSGVQTKQHQLAMMQEISKLVRVGKNPVGSLNLETANRMVSILHQYKILQHPVPYQEIYTDTFVKQIYDTQKEGRP